MRCGGSKKVNDKESVGTDGMVGELLIYQTEDGNIKLQARLENETIWLTQQMMAELFQTTIPNVSMHIKNIIFNNYVLQINIFLDCIN